eukprot:1004224-Pyramimonas_sp.AAC.1
MNLSLQPQLKTEKGETQIWVHLWSFQIKNRSNSRLPMVTACGGALTTTRGEKVGPDDPACLRPLGGPSLRSRELHLLTPTSTTEAP